MIGEFGLPMVGRLFHLRAWKGDVNVPVSTDDASSHPARRNQQDLRGIAFAQRGVLICILVYVFLVVGQFLVSESARPLLAVPAILTVLAGAVFVFMLATRAYNVVVGIILGVLTIVPVIGLFVLLIINSRATRILRSHGIAVGLLGARQTI